MKALETHAVTKVYGQGTQAVTAVDAVTMAVERGEFIALVGPSGSGKTTLLAMLAGLLKPSDGKIVIAGYDLTKMNDGQRTRFRRDYVGFTFQANNLVPYLTVRENVELMLRLGGKADRAGLRRAMDLLDRLGLGDRLNSLPSQLSGGQQQRVAIARSLIHNPAIVLADEPTASLDTERAFQVVQTFAELIHEEGHAGIMVTHDLRMCRTVDRVVYMADGHVEKMMTDKAEIEAMALGSGETKPAAAPMTGRTRLEQLVAAAR